MATWGLVSHHRLVFVTYWFLFSRDFLLYFAHLVKLWGFSNYMVGRIAAMVILLHYSFHFLLLNISLCICLPCDSQLESVSWALFSALISVVSFLVCFKVNIRWSKLIRHGFIISCYIAVLLGAFFDLYLGDPPVCPKAKQDISLKLWQMLQKWDHILSSNLLRIAHPSHDPTPSLVLDFI